MLIIDNRLDPAIKLVILMVGMIAGFLEVGSAVCIGIAVFVGDCESLLGFFYAFLFLGLLELLAIIEDLQIRFGQSA